MGIGSNIVNARQLLGMTQAQLAEKLGVARQTVAKWEHETATPDLSNAAALANALHTSLDMLIGSDEEDDRIPFLPRDKRSYGTIRMQKDGTLKLPPEAVKSFALRPGDELVVLGNPNYGIGICKTDELFVNIRSLAEKLHGR